MYTIEKIAGVFKVKTGKNFETKEEAERWLSTWLNKNEQSLLWRIWYFFPKRAHYRIVETEEPQGQEVALRINLWIPIAVLIGFLTWIHYQIKGMTLLMSLITAVGILVSIIAATLVYMLFWYFLLFKLPEFRKVIP